MEESSDAIVFKICVCSSVKTREEFDKVSIRGACRATVLEAQRTL